MTKLQGKYVTRTYQSKCTHKATGLWIRDIFHQTWDTSSDLFLSDAQCRTWCATWRLSSVASRFLRRKAASRTLMGPLKACLLCACTRAMIRHCYLSWQLSKLTMESEYWYLPFAMCLKASFTLSGRWQAKSCLPAILQDWLESSGWNVPLHCRDHAMTTIGDMCCSMRLCFLTMMHVLHMHACSERRFMQLMIVHAYTHTPGGRHMRPTWLLNLFSTNPTTPTGLGWFTTTKFWPCLATRSKY